MTRLLSIALLAATLSAQRPTLQPGQLSYSDLMPTQTDVVTTHFDGNGAQEAFYDKQPVHIGDTLPRACAIGERFLKTNNPAGDQLYLCVSAKSHWNPAPAGETWYWYSPQQENQLREMAENNGFIYFRKTIRVKGINRPYTEITHTNKPSGYWPDYKLATVSKGGSK